MATNTVEATLISKYVDQVSAGFQQTLHTMQAGMMAAASGVHALATGMAESWANFGLQLLNTSRQGQSAVQQFGFGVAGLAVLVVGAVARMGSAFVGFFSDLANRSSEVLELKLAFESLAATMGVAGDKMLGDLKKGTEGLVSSTTLLRNANRVLTADIPLTSKQYTDLVANIFKLSKASGVDATQAINTLTDSIVRGNARGLQQLGLNMGHVKDAISQFAEAAGLSTGKLENDAKLRTYYNEILRVTGEAVQRNTADYFSWADALQKSERVINDWKNAIGEAIGRSRVFEELLQRFSRSLDDMGPKRDFVESLAVSINHMIISALRLFAELLEIITAFGPLWASLYAGVKAIGSVVVDILSWVLGTITHFIGRFFELLSFIPRVGNMFKPLVQGLAELRDTLYGFQDKARESFNNAFDGFGSGVIKLEQLAAGSRSLADEMNRYANVVVQGEAGTRRHGAAAGDAATDQKKLNEQLKAYNELMKAARGNWATPEMQAILEYSDALAKIEQLTLLSEGKKNALREAAFKAWVKKMVELENEAHNKAYERMQETLKLLQMAQESVSDVKALKVPKSPEPQNLGTDPAHVALNNAELQRRQEWQRIQDVLRRQGERSTPEWMKPYREIYAELNRLNELNLSPFMQMLDLLKSHMVQIGEQLTSAWGSFWSDLVSGQENAGKKFLASIIQIFAKELLTLAMRHTYLAISAFASLDFAGGARHTAAAAALAAGSGILSGLASSMAQTNAAGAAGTSFQQNVPRPISSTQTQVIQVGAAGRAQSQGDAATQQTVKHELVLKLDKGVIVDTVKSDIKNNGPLRLVVAAATA